MFDCVIVDFQNKKSSKEMLLKKFPFALVVPFVSSYHYVIKKVLEDITTTKFWLLSTKVDYSNFNFDFIPEQHEQYQIHTWSTEGQQEGDTFLLPKKFPTDLKFLRDYKDINYHNYSTNYDFDYLEIKYDLKSVIDNLPKPNSSLSTYIKYFENKDTNNFYPSYWEDLKIYRKGTTFYIPTKALSLIKTQIYDYPLIQEIEHIDTKDCFDVAFISNGEPFEQENFDLLKDHLEKHNLGNRLYWIRNVSGRTNAYKKAADESSTEYFYAVFAKSRVSDSFRFDYTVDRALSKRHRIFHAHLRELDIQYGTFNIDLYSKTLCLDTADDKILDFTLSQPHEVVPVVANETTLAPDNYTAWKNAFREVSKLVLWQNKKPTVETKFRLNKWLQTDNEWLSKGSNDGKQFTEQCGYDEDAILKTYEWDFCREKFKSLYPTETFY